MTDWRWERIISWVSEICLNSGDFDESTPTSFPKKISMHIFWKVLTRSGIIQGISERQPIQIWMRENMFSGWKAPIMMASGTKKALPFESKLCRRGGRRHRHFCFIACFWDYCFTASGDFNWTEPAWSTNWRWSICMQRNLKKWTEWNPVFSPTSPMSFAHRLP